jgi:hypothetical protein
MLNRAAAVFTIAAGSAWLLIGLVRLTDWLVNVT